MGSDKTWRQGPNWQGPNTNRGKESAYSDGDIVSPEGTHMSGSGKSPKTEKGNKTKSGRAKLGGDY